MWFINLFLSNLIGRIATAMVEIKIRNSAEPGFHTGGGKGGYPPSSIPPPPKGGSYIHVTV